MKFVALALCAAFTQAAFQTTGETPDRDAQIFMVVDTSIHNNIADYFARATANNMKRLTAVYEEAGYTITAGVAKTGQSNKTCWKLVAPVSTDLDTLYSKIEADHFNANSGAKDRYTWYALMHAAGYEMDRSDDIRTVVLALTDTIMPWGDEVVLEDINALACGKPQPPSTQFVRYLRASRAGLIFGAIGSYQNAAENLQTKAVELFKQIDLTDVAVSKGYMWNGKNKGIRYNDHVDLLEQLLSPSWIATTSTTPSPQEKLKNCINEAFECQI